MKAQTPEEEALEALRLCGWIRARRAHVERRCPTVMGQQPVFVRHSAIYSVQSGPEPFL